MRLNLICCLLVGSAWFSCAPRYVAVPSGSGYYEPGYPDTVIPDGDVSTAIEPWKSHLDSVMNRVICISDFALEKGVPESGLGNLVADACFGVFQKQFRSGQTDRPVFCMLNNGGLRSALPAGPVLLRHIYELMPFENELVVVTLNAPAIRALFDYIRVQGGVPVSNLNMSLSDSLYESVSIGKKLFVDSLDYEVLTSDYLAGGGDRMDMFQDSIRYEMTGIKVRDAIIRYLTEHGCASKRSDGRITR